MEKGRFITFEGGEGCGKTTQIGRLRDALVREGVEVVMTREPGGTWLAEQIRHLIKDQKDEAPCDRSELLMFLAARAQLVREVIRPAIEAGKWVLSDRFSDSTVAYQGYGRGLPQDFIRRANEFACGGLKPDMTLLFKVSAETAARRMRRREAATASEADRIERAGDAFHERLRRGFEEMAAAEPERFVAIDANGTVDEVWEEVWKSMRRFR